MKRPELQIELDDVKTRLGELVRASGPYLYLFMILVMAFWLAAYLDLQ